MRSMLFVPGDRPERFAKAVASGADAVIFDLEDSVVPDRRKQARHSIAEFIASANTAVGLWVRINPVDTRDALVDLVAVFEARPQGIVLPKATRGDDLWRVDHWLEALEVRAGREKNETQLLPLITENARAVLNAASFVKVPARVPGFTWGAEDLAADLGALANRDERGEFEPPFELARSYCLLAAAAAGVLAIDTIDPEIRDTEAVQRRAGDSRRQGFTGKLAIHPAQIAPIHSAFTPSEQEVRRARAVLQAFEASPGAGAVALEGRMLDKPHLRQAQRVLAVAGSLSEQNGEKLP